MPVSLAPSGRHAIQAELVAAIVQLIKLVHAVVEQPQRWAQLSAELENVEQWFTGADLVALKELGTMLRPSAQRFERASPIKLSPIAIHATVPSDDVYFKLASLLPFGRYDRSRARVSSFLTDVLECNVLQAMENRLLIVQVNIRGATLRSCVEGLGQPVLTINAAGECVFTSEKARSLLGAATADPVQHPAMRYAVRTAAKRIRESPPEQGIRWMPEPIDTTIDGQRIRLHVALAAPTRRMVPLRFLTFFFLCQRLTSI